MMRLMTYVTTTRFLDFRNLPSASAAGLFQKKKKSFLAGSSSVLYFNDSLNKLMARFSSTIVVELIEGRWSLQALVQHTSQALNVHVIGPLHELKDVSLGRESPPKPNYCRHFSERGLTVFVGI